MRPVAMVWCGVVLAACGRGNFDPVPDGGPDAESDAAMEPSELYIKASNASPGDWFGVNLMLADDGQTLVVGSTNEDSSATGVDGDRFNEARPTSGAVYVFAHTSQGWVEQSYLKASNPDAGDQFGHHMSLSADGSVLAVTALNEDSVATGVDGDQLDNTALQAGAVYVFQRTGATWAQTAYLKGSNTEAGDRFGYNHILSRDGRTLVISADNEDSAATGIDGNQLDNSATTAGAVYVFTLAGTTWTQQAYLKASNTDAGDAFGTGLALSADATTLAIGANRESSNATGINGNQLDNSLGSAGALYVFGRSGTTWSQDAYIKASNAGLDDRFAGGVAISGDGNTIIANAPGEASASPGVDGNEADDSMPNAGAAYVFERAGSVWSQRAYLKSASPDAGDSFGRSWTTISSDGALIAIAAFTDDGVANALPDSGGVFLFSRSGSSWTAPVELRAPNAGATDGFGSALRVAGDGSPIVVGAFRESSAGRGIGTDPSDNSAAESGAVYVFNR